ncbi:MAG TPA: Xaa-Pro peptidase family protein [Parvularculaceae bacterium]|nr:Xaa-Pro peptidase family protein [Parvularculaceae bacterium]
MVTAASQSKQRRLSRRPFPEEEYDARLKRVRQAMAERSLDGMLISSPENIYYLTGLNYLGYFAYQLLVVPLTGAPALATRAMEHATIRDKVPGVRHVTYSDGVAPLPENAGEDEASAPLLDGEGGLRPWSTSLGVPTRPAETSTSIYENPARATIEAIEDAGLDSSRLGIESSSSLFPYGIGQAIVSGLPKARFEHATNLVTDVRLVQSPSELVFTRRAASVTDSMILAGVAAAGPGVPQADVMAAIYQTMFHRRGTYPGFVPLVRATRTLEHEHGSWEDVRLGKKDILFLEMSGCVERYHAPAGRLVFTGAAPKRAYDMERVCEEAIEAAKGKMKPGVAAEDVYSAWQGVVDRAGLHGYRRHHCGYAVGIGFPPSWSGGGVPLGLRAGSKMELKAGMVFHLMSWLLRTGKGDYFLSDTVVVTSAGCERLTMAQRSVVVR